jgi:hypothetical protein
LRNHVEVLFLGGVIQLFHGQGLVVYHRGEPLVEHMAELHLGCWIGAAEGDQFLTKLELFQWVQRHH